MKQMGAGYRQRTGYIGADNCMDGTAVTNALAPVNTSKKSGRIILYVIQ